MDFERRDLGRRRTKQRKYVRYFAIIVVIAVVVFGWYKHALWAVDSSDDSRVTVTVPTGAGMLSVAQEMKAKGLIRSTQAFSWHARFDGKDRLVRAGTYVLQPSMSVDEILLVLTGGAVGEVSVTIPEGFTVADIDRLMAAKGFTETGAIIACAKTCDFSAFEFLPNEYDGPGGRVEGYLYPDTYFVGGEGSDPRAFLTRLLSTFDQKVVQGQAWHDIDADDRRLTDAVIIASLVEKEAANDEERPIIAGIIWKRDEAGMILGIDAAVRYAVNKAPTVPLTSADLAMDSPYNLRRYAFLPPGPIANPGLASIMAAANPEETPYFYYLHGNDGKIHYAVTNDEHNANRAKYLR